MKSIVTYTRHGQKYTESFTTIQARKDLKDYGYPGANQLTNKDVLNAIHEIFF